MIEHVRNTPLTELFSGEINISFNIPKYQREYIWSKWNWETLFDDIEESSGGHFLGSIICINTEKDSLKPPKLELVDGQQRMTTLSLLYLALYRYLENNCPDSDNEEMQDDIKALRNKIIVKSTRGLKLTPSYTNNNYDDYKWLFFDEIKYLHVDGKPNNKPSYWGLRLIAKAYHYFLSRFNATEVLSEGAEPTFVFDYYKAVKFLEKINLASIVKIDVNSHTDAFILFETLNNRGVALSVIDIVKNKLLGELEKNDANSLDENFERWNSLLKNLTDDYNLQERFLRQFYNGLKSYPNIGIDKIPKAMRSNLIRIFETLINKNAKAIFNSLEEASMLYNKNIIFEIESNTIELKAALRNLENVNGTDGYMLLLFLDKKFQINETEKIKLVNLLCRYFIRRNVTDSPPTRDMTNYFMDIIENLSKKHDYSYSEVETLLIQKAKPASDAYFREKLMGDLYEDNIGATRFILSSLETHLSGTIEHDYNFYARNKNIFVWTIEHIFPQGDNIPSCWVDMVANGDKTLAIKIKNEYVHKLGNLTLTGYNSTLSNSPLKDKQDKKNSDDKYIGFKNGLKLNEDIKDAYSWNKESIIARTEKLVDVCLNMFKI
jgi:uncharacterized protein with ParB-like and HNH nuclease domain